MSAFRNSSGSVIICACLTSLSGISFVRQSTWRQTGCLTCQSSLFQLDVARTTSYSTIMRCHFTTMRRVTLSWVGTAHEKPSRLPGNLLHTHQPLKIPENSRPWHAEGGDPRRGVGGVRRHGWDRSRRTRASSRTDPLVPRPQSHPDSGNHLQTVSRATKHRTTPRESKAIKPLTLYCSPSLKSVLFFSRHSLRMACALKTNPLIFFCSAFELKRVSMPIFLWLGLDLFRLVWRYWWEAIRIEWLKQAECCKEDWHGYSWEGFWREKSESEVRFRSPFDQCL